ncbi:MAG: hypothetical protein IJ223_04565 [Clostridia bacterium]|nr:hypothetical protein [Clostridia bacterium]
MAKVQLNRKISGFTVFEVSNKDEYLRCIDPSAHLNNGKIELSGCLLDGREMFSAIVRNVYFNLPKVIGFTLRGYNVLADDYILSCGVPLQLIDKRPGFQEYEFVR